MTRQVLQLDLKHHLDQAENHLIAAWTLAQSFQDLRPESGLKLRIERGPAQLQNKVNVPDITIRFYMGTGALGRVKWSVIDQPAVYVNWCLPVAGWSTHICIFLRRALTSLMISLWTSFGTGNWWENDKLIKTHLCLVRNMSQRRHHPEDVNVPHFWISEASLKTDKISLIRSKRRTSKRRLQKVFYPVPSFPNKKITPFFMFIVFVFWLPQCTPFPSLPCGAFRAVSLIFVSHSEGGRVEAEKIGKKMQFPAWEWAKLSLTWPILTCGLLRAVRRMFTYQDPEQDQKSPARIQAYPGLFPALSPLNSYQFFSDIFTKCHVIFSCHHSEHLSDLWTFSDEHFCKTSVHYSVTMLNCFSKNTKKYKFAHLFCPRKTLVFKRRIKRSLRRVSDNGFV